MLAERQMSREAAPVVSDTFINALQSAVSEVSGATNGEAFTAAMLGKCQEATHALVYYLLEQPDIYEHVAILACHNMPKEHATGWLSHYGVLAKPKGGVWHATSPANYRHDRIEHRVAVGCLDDVLAQYQQMEGGIWVSPEYVHQTLLAAEVPGDFEVDQHGNTHIVTTALETDGRYRESPFFMRSRPYVYQVGPAV